MTLVHLSSQLLGLSIIMSKIPLAKTWPLSWQRMNTCVFCMVTLNNKDILLEIALQRHLQFHSCEIRGRLPQPHAQEISLSINLSSASSSLSCLAMSRPEQVLTESSEIFLLSHQNSRKPTQPANLSPSGWHQSTSVSPGNRTRSEQWSQKLLGTRVMQAHALQSSRWLMQRPTLVSR